MSELIELFFSAVHGLDEQFQEYKCPVFMGCLVTVSGLSNDERKEVKKLVEREGMFYQIQSCKYEYPDILFLFLHKSMSWRLIRSVSARHY